MNLKIIIPVLGLLFLILPLSQIDGQESKKIVGEDENSKITIELTDGVPVSYSLDYTHDGSEKVTLENPFSKFKIKEDRFLIIDPANSVVILGKNIADKKYIIVSKIKIDSEKVTKRWIIDIEKPKIPTGQRNLFEEASRVAEPVVDDSFKAAYNKAKAERIAQAEAEHQKNLIRLDETNAKKSTTRDANTGLSYEDYKKQSYDRDDDRTLPKNVSKNTSNATSLKVFVSSPHSVEWKKSWIYDVLVTDEIKTQYKSNYKSFIGNPIEDAAVSTVIKNPSGSVLHESSGETGADGLYDDFYIIPDQSTQRGAYLLEVTATKSIDGVMYEASTEKEFFVTADSGSYNNPPVANFTASASLSTDVSRIVEGPTTKELILITPIKMNATHNPYVLVMLNGTHSDDVDDENDDLIFTWSVNVSDDDNVEWLDSIDSMFTNFFNATDVAPGLTLANAQRLIPNELEKESEVIIFLNATSMTVFNFELDVSDGRKTSKILPEISVTVYNGTLWEKINGSISMCATSPCI